MVVFVNAINVRLNWNYISSGSLKGYGSIDPEILLFTPCPCAIYVEVVDQTGDIFISLTVVYFTPGMDSSDVALQIEPESTCY